MKSKTNKFVCKVYKIDPEVFFPFFHDALHHWKQDTNMKIIYNNKFFMLNLDMKSIIEYLKCTWLKYTQNDRLSSHTASAHFD